MLKLRLIPVLYLMNGLIVRSERFEDFKVIGNPFAELERYSEWMADELVYIDITRDGDHDIRRDDHKTKNAGGKIEILRGLAQSAFMPLTFGGRISSIAEIDAFLHNGADKVLLNTSAWRDNNLVTEAAKRHGSQAVMVGIDVRQIDGKFTVWTDQGRHRTDEDLAAYAKKQEQLGAGEILVTSIDRDGGAEGFDVDAIRIVAEAVSIPVIACGGAGAFSDFKNVIDKTAVSAVAAGNIFHFTENSYKRAKKYLQDKGYSVRYPYIS